MRPLSAALALAYALSFAAACLGACLGGEMAQHGCCPSEQQGLRTSHAVQDCCKVVPGISGKNLAPAVPCVATLAVAHEVLSSPTIVDAAPPPPASAGPPLILRI
jgi:hypothetical protein